MQWVNVVVSRSTRARSDIGGSSVHGNSIFKVASVHECMRRHMYLTATRNTHAAKSVRFTAARNQASVYVPGQFDEPIQAISTDHKHACILE